MHTQTLTEHPDLGSILRRTAVPFLLFATVLTGLLVLSWTLLLPTLTHIEVAGEQKSLAEIEAYEKELQGNITALEAERDAYLLPVQNELYENLLELKEGRFRFQEVRREVSRVAQALVPEEKDAVAFSAFLFNGVDNIAEIRGQVHNVGPRSMTVLAQFIDALKEIPFVKDIESSRFTREEEKPGEFYSPFTIRIFLKPL